MYYSKATAAVTTDEISLDATFLGVKVVGQFNGLLEHHQWKSTQPIYVVQGLKNDLLGLPAITALQLLH